MHITQAVIAAGGAGTRLRPTTDTVPKVMIPVLGKPFGSTQGKPLLEWHLEQFRKHGVREFFFTLHYLPSVVTDYFGDGSKWGVKVSYFVETTPLGSTGGIKQFEGALDDTFFFIYGDVFSVVDYTKMAKAFAAKPDAIGLERVARTEDYADADVAEIDADGKFIAIHPKPHAGTYPNAYRMRGIFTLKKKILSYIPDGVPYELGNQLLPEVIRCGEAFYGYECDEYSKGIDTIEKWREVEEYLTAQKENL